MCLPASIACPDRLLPLLRHLGVEVDLRRRRGPARRRGRWSTRSARAGRRCRAACASLRPDQDRLGPQPACRRRAAGRPRSRIASSERTRCWRYPIRPVTPLSTMPIGLARHPIAPISPKESAFLRKAIGTGAAADKGCRSTTCGNTAAERHSSGASARRSAGQWRRWPMWRGAPRVSPGDRVPRHQRQRQARRRRAARPGAQARSPTCGTCPNAHAQHAGPGPAQRRRRDRARRLRPVLRRDHPGPAAGGDRPRPAAGHLQQLPRPGSASWSTSSCCAPTRSAAIVLAGSGYHDAAFTRALNTQAARLRARPAAGSP